jgi:hypothetical protein
MQSPLGIVFETIVSRERLGPKDARLGLRRRGGENEVELDVGQLDAERAPLLPPLPLVVLVEER